MSIVKVAAKERKDYRYEIGAGAGTIAALMAASRFNNATGALIAGSLAGIGGAALGTTVGSQIKRGHLKKTIEKELHSKLKHIVKSHGQKD